MSEEFEAYITQYALSGGIQKRTVTLCVGSVNMVQLEANGFTQYFHGEGKDWHRTYESAWKRAEAMRVKKLASVEKQLRKLQTPFPEVEP